MGGWLALTQPGLSPGKKRQASLDATNGRNCVQLLPVYFRITLKLSIFKHKAVYLINLYSPDETDVTSVWLISRTYKARDIDYSITEKAWDHDY